MRFLLLCGLCLLLVGCSLPPMPLGQRPDPTVEAIQTQVALMAEEQLLMLEATPTPRPPLPVLPTLPPVSPQPTLGAELTEPLLSQERLLVELFRRANPAVVSIDVLGSSLPSNHPAIPGLPDARSGQGSGFLYDDQGHIVTNNHVVARSSQLQVRFFDGTTALADLVGTDPDSDLAVIRVRRLPEGVGPLTLGESRAVEVGQTAVAIGSPFGEQNTLTVGVVSGVGRTLRGPTRSIGTYSIPNIIQTDASINPGNSGGPLLNIRGEVIGVNTAIAVSQGNSSFEGVGYAVPASTVAKVVPGLISEGRFDHPWMGIAMLSLDALMAERLGLEVDRGVLITDVRSPSPAQRAGLRAGTGEPIEGMMSLQAGGDIIIAIGGQFVADSDQLLGLLDLNYRAGDTAVLTVVRANGTTEEVDLLLDARP
ncbi:S1C family serine protease [Candidatus Chloroploca asiatica]|uniref:2-alkenal reductase n=1 Tax=Candidatus Chloroploca asiatica TaxID=1506545 RepID=A0A2H3L645_9CHLR|nr:trypsin-like peptidase domain-containing protein [Candidatus Chloroploca asiatica]PDV97715.1 2-alkenal reductase [Candidatus Chloroploca asiatica]